MDYLVITPNFNNDVVCRCVGQGALYCKSYCKNKCINYAANIFKNNSAIFR